MASAQPSFSYDVFLSFRGEDTRRSFTDHLYRALNQEGIRTFRDDDEMDRGKVLKPELEKAIHQSAISLVVFSENYASSKWCLDEITTIMKEKETASSKHEVIPVFYKVEPSDVRNQRGSFEKAFDVYEDTIKAERNGEKKKELLEKVKGWKDSLEKAASLTGMVLSKDGYESELITDIVKAIRKNLNYKALYIEEKLVGIKGYVTEIENWLQDPSPDAVTLLIVGMGGIGKSTIAKFIYNSNAGNYDGYCFLAKISETLNQPHGLLRLQSQLLSKILKSGKEETVWNADEGTNQIKNAICNKKVLLILDDVTRSEQLDALLGPKRFHPGSKVIITTRHTELSTAFQVHPKVQSVKNLCTSDAIRLFSLYAFNQDQPFEPYIVQSELFVSYCTGLPLALKVLGSSLRGNTIDVWEDTKRKLEEIPNSKIQKVLEISYDTLADEKDKDLFLDIACFFEGEKEDYTVKLLAECGLYPVVGIKNLTDRCLLSVEHERVQMHELIRKMGREVVRQESPKDPGKRSRLWRHDDCISVLHDHNGTGKVHGFMLDMKMMKGPNFKLGAIENMKNLMLLQVNNVTFYGKYKNLPKKLRLLRWHGFSQKSIPSNICLEKLVELDMSYSKLKSVWVGFMLIGSLKILNLSYSEELIETPDFVGLPGLESLILKGCSSLIKVHESIAYLRELVLLDLTDCRSLRDFPRLPPSLVRLEMSGCLDHGVLGRVKCLGPDSSFSFLGEANISYCNLTDDFFPNDWSNMVSLRTLELGGNNLITSLPKSFQTLPALDTLIVGGCSKLESILGLPESLRILSIRTNDSLRKVQPAVRNPHRITVMHDCPNLCEVEGHHKVQSADKVDRKIIQYLGLKSNADDGKELDVKVLHEFGIFSTFVSDGQIPSSFLYQNAGSNISFTVPWVHDGSRISGFSVCAMLSKATFTYKFAFVEMIVYNETKDVAWLYNNGNQEICQNVEKRAWLCLCRCGNMLEVGDEVRVRIKFLSEFEVEECCINLIYEDDDEVDGERQEADHVRVSDQMSWSDRMLEDISDYTNEGDYHMFKSTIWVR